MSSLNLAFIGGLFLIYAFSENIKKNKKKEMRLAISLSFFTIFGFAISSEVFRSGYHFIDDHEFFVLNKNIQNDGLWSALDNYVRHDLTIRFRPTYTISRVFFVFLFGTNFEVWHFFIAIVSVISVFLCYCFARRMECPVWLSYIFPMMIFGGQQMSVLWRLGPQENYGVLLLMTTLLLLIKYINDRKTINLVLLMLGTILLSGIKEAFLLLVPLLPLWAIYYEQVYHRKKKINLTDIAILAKKNKVYSIFVFLIFIVNLSFIVFKIGFGYVSGGEKNILDYLKYIVTTFSYPLKLYVLISVIGICFGILLFVEKKQKKNFLKEVCDGLLFPTFMLVYILCTQLVLHAGSGLMERYILPTSIAFAIFWIIDVYNFLRLKRYDEKYSHVFYFMIGIVFLTRLIDSYDLEMYVDDGRQTTQMLEMVSELADDETKIIVSFEYEWDYSASVYLEEKYDITNVYNLNFGIQNEDGKAKDGYGINENALLQVECANIYMGKEEKIQELFEQHQMNMDEYEEYNFGYYILLVEKDMEEK